MIIDYKFDGKYVAVVGGGSEAFSKVRNFLDAGCKVLVISRNFSKGILELHAKRRVDLLKTEVKDSEFFVKQLKPKPDLLAIATSDHKLNSRLAKSGRDARLMVYVADDPGASDFILPAVSKIGDVRITVSTGGKSPAMAKTLRERIESVITQQDLLHIELQEFMRRVLKDRVGEQKTRRSILYEILEDVRVNELLKEGKLNQAKNEAIDIMENVIIGKREAHR